MPQFPSPHTTTPTPNRTSGARTAQAGMPPAHPPATARQTVRIPADVDLPDRVLAGLTARQLLVLSITGIVLYAAWTVTRGVVALPVFLLGAIPVGVTAMILVLGQRDGISLDRLMLAALGQRLTPRYQVTAPKASTRYRGGWPPGSPLRPASRPLRRPRRRSICPPRASPRPAWWISALMGSPW